MRASRFERSYRGKCRLHLRRDPVGRLLPRVSVLISLLSPQLNAYTISQELFSELLRVSPANVYGSSNLLQRKNTWLPPFHRQLFLPPMSQKPFSTSAIVRSLLFQFTLKKQYLTLFHGDKFFTTYVTAPREFLPVYHRSLTCPNVLG